MRCWQVSLHREIVEEHFFATRAEANAFVLENGQYGIITLDLSAEYPNTNAGLAQALTDLIDRTCYNEG
jgi:hypothetical protein